MELQLKPSFLPLVLAACIASDLNYKTNFWFTPRRGKNSKATLKRRAKNKAARKARR